MRLHRLLGERRLSWIRRRCRRQLRRPEFPQRPTFFFLYVIIGTTSKAAAVGFAGIPIGCLTLIHLFLIPVTNASVNPARSTGPALFAGGAYIAQLWLFRLAPILGAAIAGVVSRWQHDLPDAK